MTIDVITQHLALPLPHPDNDLEDDVLRLGDALSILDGAVHGVQQQLVGKADAVGTAQALQALDDSVQALQADKADAATVAAALGEKADADAVVSSVNGKVGNVTLNAAEVGAVPAAGFAPGGVQEVGRYLDFHTAANGYDYDVRMDAQAGASAGAGTLVLTAGGGLTCTGNVTAYSDLRLKTDLTAIPDALDKVQALTGYTYTRKDTGVRQTGLIAQDVRKVLPEAVMDDGEHLSLAYGNLVGLLVQAIKELSAEVKALKGRA